GYQTTFKGSDFANTRWSEGWFMRATPAARFTLWKDGVIMKWEPLTWTGSTSCGELHSGLASPQCR
ncbi:hypothetical protein M569_16176, partial [Genlisea aurea]